MLFSAMARHWDFFFFFSSQQGCARQRATVSGLATHQLPQHLNNTTATHTNNNDKHYDKQHGYCRPQLPTPRIFNFNRRISKPRGAFKTWLLLLLRAARSFDHRLFRYDQQFLEVALFCTLRTLSLLPLRKPKTWNSLVSNELIKLLETSNHIHSAGLFAAIAYCIKPQISSKRLTRSIWNWSYSIHYWKLHTIKWYWYNIPL